MGQKKSRKASVLKEDNYNSESENEIDFNSLKIVDLPPSEDEAEFSEGEDLIELNEDELELAFPESNSDEDTVEGEDDFEFKLKEKEEEEEEDSEEELPSSDTELSDWQNSDLEVEGEGSKKLNKGGYTGEKLPEIEPIYDSDSSTEETHNTVGNVPMHWYDDYPHIGYDIDGKKIYKPAKGDELDKFLDTVDDPESWKTIENQLEQNKIRLTDEELQIIQRITKGQFSEISYDPYPDTIEYFTSKVRDMPLSGKMEPKRRFIPSKAENRKIMKIVKAIREGRIVAHKPKSQNANVATFDIWNNATESSIHRYIPAPKKALPDHAESYNPPEEYLLDEEELKAWKNTEPSLRRRDFIPQKFNSLRQVPGYARSFQESFKRCLDLYLNPRVRKDKLDIDPESLIPKLPDPKELQPFPTKLSIVYQGHEGRVRCFSIDPTGVYLVSGSDDHTVKLWEIRTGRCLQSIELEGVIHSIAWNPNPDISLIAATCENKVVFILPQGTADTNLLQNTESLVEMAFKNRVTNENSGLGEWKKASSEEKEIGILFSISHKAMIKQVTWHRKGDYFATVAPKDGGQSILIHQLRKLASQRPFKGLKGSVQKVLFHPTRPTFVIMTQKYVRLYNLQLQKLEKTLLPGAQWLSSVDVHPQGDNVIVGTYDRKLSWFDLDLSSKPYKTMRFHSEAIRSVNYHKRYPLFASGSDDGTIQIFHGRVFSDLLQNPLIVPVKILRGHQRIDQLGVLNVQFHPVQPWLITAGADGLLHLYI